MMLAKALTAAAVFVGVLTVLLLAAGLFWLSERYPRRWA